MKKIVPPKKVSLKGRLLRFFGTNRSLEDFPSYQGSPHVPTPTESYYSNRKEIRTALLEAELRKAETLMEWQRCHIIR